MANELDELGAPLAGVTPALELHQVKYVAGQQRDAVDGLGGNQLAHSRVAGVDQRCSFVHRHHLVHAADIQRDIHCRYLVDRNRDILLDQCLKSLRARPSI